MYCKVHIGFVHEMMARKIVSWNEARELLSNCAEQLSVEEKIYDLGDTIDEINDRLRDLKMQIRILTCEVTGERLCALVITTETYVSRLSSKYTPNELQLFHHIMAAIVTSDNSCATLDTCVNLNTKLPEAMTLSESEAAVERFLEDKWFIQANEGMVYLGARCISEMQDVIKDLYSDHVGNCPLCQQLVILGETCKSCMCRTHFHCLEKNCLEIQEGNVKICYNCGSDKRGEANDVDD